MAKKRQEEAKRSHKAGKNTVNKSQNDRNCRSFKNKENVKILRRIYTIVLLDECINNFIEKKVDVQLLVLIVWLAKPQSSWIKLLVAGSRRFHALIKAGKPTNTYSIRRCWKQLKNKFITYKDKDGKYRTEKVIKITGNYLTVKNAVKTKHRIHKDRVSGRQFRKRGLEKIKW